MRIMYVEDNPANLFLVKRVARMGNHEVVNYIDGDDVLANFDGDGPDLVLMDIQLVGEKSGLDVVRDLRKQGHKTPIIAVTAYAMSGDRERCLDAGCDEYMAKPLSVPSLIDVIKRYEGKKGTSQQDGDTPKTLPTAPDMPAVNNDKSTPAAKDNNKSSAPADTNASNTDTPPEASSGNSQ